VTKVLFEKLKKHSRMSLTVGMMPNPGRSQLRDKVMLVTRRDVLHTYRAAFIPLCSYTM